MISTKKKNNKKQKDCEKEVFVRRLPKVEVPVIYIDGNRFIYKKRVDDNGFYRLGLWQNPNGDTRILATSWLLNDDLGLLKKPPNPNPFEQLGLSLRFFEPGRNVEIENLFKIRPIIASKLISEASKDRLKNKKIILRYPSCSFPIKSLEDLRGESGILNLYIVCSKIYDKMEHYLFCSALSNSGIDVSERQIVWFFSLPGTMIDSPIKSNDNGYFSMKLRERKKLIQTAIETQMAGIIQEKSDALDRKVKTDIEPVHREIEELNSCIDELRRKMRRTRATREKAGIHILLQKAVKNRDSVRKKQEDIFIQNNNMKEKLLKAASEVSIKVKHIFILKWMLK